MTDNSIPLFKVYMNDNLDYVMNTLGSGMITQGKKVEEFEEKLKKYFNYPYLLTLNSATSGLTLAYRILDLKPSVDYVISTPLTCFATNASILANNLNIIWADTDPESCNIDLEDVKKKINSNTKALSFVHWGGNPVDLNKVEELKKYAFEKYEIELKVIEDCAHAFGAELNYKKLGTHGNICVFSLQAIKHLTSGDGGLIFLPNEEMYKRAKLLRWFGIDREKRSLPGSDFRLEPDITEYGYKFHMNDINASIGMSNLPNIENILEKCRSNAKFYRDNLNSLDSIKLFEEHEHSNPSYWIYTIKILFNRKNEFIQYMKFKGIVVSQVHARNDKHSCLKNYSNSLPNLDILETQIVSIPVGWWVTEEQRIYIVDCIREFSDSLYITTLNTEDSLEEYARLLYQMNEYTQPNKNLELSEDVSKTIYIMKLNNKIVCTAKLFIEEKLYQSVGHIEDVVTDNEYRNKGYGKSLIKYLIDIAIKDMCCYKVILSCKESLDNFYLNCGMSKTGSSFTVYK